jgi:hypothetical protein
VRSADETRSAHIWLVVALVVVGLNAGRFGGIWLLVPLASGIAIGLWVRWRRAAAGEARRAALQIGLLIALMAAILAALLLMFDDES